MQQNVCSRLHTSYALNAVERHRRPQNRELPEDHATRRQRSDSMNAGAADLVNFSVPRWAGIVKAKTGAAARPRHACLKRGLTCR